MPLTADGVLPAGIHDYDFATFEKEFIAEFPSSQTRSRIMDSLKGMLLFLYHEGYAPYEIWIDGSYVTNKINPNDVDVVIFLPWAEFNGKPMDKTQFPSGDDVDCYFSVAVMDENQLSLSPRDCGEVVNQRNYWRGQFGFDRDDKPKGIVSLSCNSLLTAIQKGGDN